MSERRSVAMLVMGLAWALSGCASSGTGLELPAPPALPAPPSDGSSDSSPQSPPSPTGSPESSATSPNGEEAAEAGETVEAQEGEAPDAASEKSAPDATTSGSAQGSAARTQDEQRTALDGELERSLSEFDEAMGKEQQAIGARRDAGDGTRAESREARSASGRSRGGLEGPGEPGTEESHGRSRGAGSGGSPDAPPGESGEPDQAEAGDREDDAQDDNGRVPADIGDGRDDDVVARQLREAAMKEEDPELREKLWEEYRRYKRGEG